MGHTYSSKNGSKRYRYYVCLTAHKRGWDQCPSKSIPAGEVERFVLDRVKCIGKDPDLLAATLTQVRALAEKELASLNAEHQELERDLGRSNDQVRKMIGQVSPDDVESPATARLADLQDRIRSAERRATEVRERTIALQRQLIDRRDVVR